VRVARGTKQQPASRRPPYRRPRSGILEVVKAAPPEVLSRSMGGLQRLAGNKATASLLQRRACACGGGKASGCECSLKNSLTEMPEASGHSSTPSVAVDQERLFTRSPVQRVHNGCGPADWRGHFVPNGLGYYNFEAACNDHDECYGTCRTSKDSCDMQLWREAFGTCRTGFWGRPCQNAAYYYYSAVHNWGDGAFQAAQASCTPRSP
jgi:hypothetical protein